MPNRYSSKAVERASGVPARTIHDWVRKKVLAPPVGRGRGARYSETHVAAARVIRQMRESGVSLPAIRARISGRRADELMALLPSAAATNTPAASAASSLNANLAGLFRGTPTLQVVELRDGLKLMVDAERSDALRIAEDIYRHYAVFV